MTIGFGPGGTAGDPPLDTPEKRAAAEARWKARRERIAALQARLRAGEIDHEEYVRQYHGAVSDHLAQIGRVELTAATITDAQILALFYANEIAAIELTVATLPGWSAEDRRETRERCAKILNDRSGRANEPVLDAAAGVRRDQQHGLLPEDDGDLGREGLRPSEDVGAAALVRAHDHLDGVPVLAPSLPDPARLEEGRALELALDEGLERVTEHRPIERHGKSPVATDLAGDAGADVEAHGAGGTDGHESSIPAKTEASKDALERRAGREASRFYLYFEIDRGTGQISIETSWLPDVPKVIDALVPLGFRRKSDGSYRAELSDADDHVGILRRATRAIALLVEEATL